ncbi:MAG TPA: PDDEXK nuclease domain-containing protein [Candidatus Sulfotelmatobacter sp.]
MARETSSICGPLQAYPDHQFVQQVVAQLPWGHNVRILEMVKVPEKQEWYIRQAVESGWTRNVLVHQIESDLYRRQGQAVTNFQRTLPAPQSELAQELLKDPYHFDFLTVGTEMLERDLERGLMDHLRDFILNWARDLPSSATSTIWKLAGKIILSIYFFIICTFVAMW